MPQDKFKQPRQSVPIDTICPVFYTGSQYDPQPAAAVAIAEGLGVKLSFVTPDWEVITVGGWSDRWDISVGSMTILEAANRVIYMDQGEIVEQDSPDSMFSKPSDPRTHQFLERVL